MPPVRLRRTLAALAVVVAAGAGLSLASGASEADIVVGVGSTVEHQVLAALTVAALDDAGVAVEARTGLGGTVGLRREALGGEVDLIWDHTGAAWALGLGQEAPPADPEESFERVRRADEDHGLVWLPPSRANATLALFVREETLPSPEEPRGMEWLAGVLSRGEGKLCADPDFISRPGGLESLAEAYAMDLDRVEDVAATEEEAIAAVASGRCLAGLATATSGAARAAGLVPVADELRVFPAFVAAPVVRADALARVPAVAAALERVTERLDTPMLARLNALVEEGADPAVVADEVLEDAPPARSDD